MAKIYDFTDYRLNKMTPWQRMVEIDRQTKRVAKDITDLGVEVRNSEVVPPRKTNWGKVALTAMAVVGVCMWLNSKK